MEQDAPLRALVVDDSAFMRKMVSDILRKDGIEVVGTARDGLDGLEKARGYHPDVITLDVEMPRMDGVAFLRVLMRDQPTPVVMLSSATTEGAAVTLQCLEMGAFDFVHKPSGSISLDIERVTEDILTKVREAVRAGRMKGRLFHAPLRPFLPVGAGKPATSGLDCSAEAEVIVIIASSTGGPAALHHVVPVLPGDLPVSVVIVQHLPAGFSKSMADRLNQTASLRVREAEPGDKLTSGTVLVAPAGRHLCFDERGHVVLTAEPPLWGVRPAADVTLGSAAERFGSRAIAVVLTGMGRDGALGAKAVRQRGGLCLAQNEETCVVFGMPRAAREAGAVDRLLPLNEIGGAIIEGIHRITGSKSMSR